MLMPVLRILLLLEMMAILFLFDIKNLYSATMTMPAVQHDMAKKMIQYGSAREFVDHLLQNMSQTSHFGDQDSVTYMINEYFAILSIVEEVFLGIFPHIILQIQLTPEDKKEIKTTIYARFVSDFIRILRPANVKGAKITNVRHRLNGQTIVTVKTPEVTGVQEVLLMIAKKADTSHGYICTDVVIGGISMKKSYIDSWGQSIKKAKNIADIKTVLNE